MKIEIEINESCKNCKKELKYFKLLQKRHKSFYANMDMKTYKLLTGILLNPDFNSEGYLTHFHIIKADKDNLLKTIKAIETSEHESEVMKKAHIGRNFTGNKLNEEMIKLEK
jgi:hypothetical protein